MREPRILYYCYDSDKPAGGEKESYQHVDVLNRHGIQAYAVHSKPGFRFTWFENSTRVTCLAEIQRDATRDILVLPENLGLRIHSFRGPRVIFNKGIYLGFKALGLARDGPRVYVDDETIAILCMSDHNREYLRFAYGNKPVYAVHPDIRPSVFAYQPLSKKRLKISYAAKASTHGRTLYQLLMGRAALGLNRLASVEWVPIVNLSERQVVSQLQESLIFLFLSVDEGLPRLPLEAMACGCLVCAYDCGPLVEAVPKAYRFPYGDLLSIAQRIEHIVDAYPHGLGAFEELTIEARRCIEKYCVADQEPHLVNAWRDILAARRT